MFCKNCGNQLDDHAMFCTKCGEKISGETKEKYCIHCGTKLDEDASFCLGCGRKLGDSVTDNFILVEGGTFQMGSINNKRGQTETVESFYICDHTVTQSEWTKIMTNNPSHFRGENRPVESVSWCDAIQFCNKLSRIKGLTEYYNIEGNFKKVEINPEADGYRLPTEAEWEFAARGGNKSKGYKYSGRDDFESMWFSGNSNKQTHDVKTALPNELELYDMSGNVREWCFYTKFHDYCPNRGGCWCSSDKDCYPTSRNRVYYKSYKSGLHTTGFRLVRSCIQEDSVKTEQTLSKAEERQSTYEKEAVQSEPSADPSIITQPLESAWQESLGTNGEEKTKVVAIHENDNALKETDNNLVKPSKDEKRIEELENRCAKLTDELKIQRMENEKIKKQNEQNIILIVKRLLKEKKVFIILSVIFIITTIIGFGLCIHNYNNWKTVYSERQQLQSKISNLESDKNQLQYAKEQLENDYNQLLGNGVLVDITRVYNGANNSTKLDHSQITFLNFYYTVYKTSNYSNGAKLYVKIINPFGKLEIGSGSSGGYTMEVPAYSDWTGWGNSTAGSSYINGSYTIEFWHDGICVGRKVVYIS